MSSFFDDILSKARVFFSQQPVKEETLTFKPSPYPVPRDVLSLEGTFWQADPFYKFFRSAVDLIRGLKLPDNTEVGSEIKLAGFDGIDIGNFQYKLKEWYDKAIQYGPTLAQLIAVQAKVDKLSGLILPDGTALFSPENIKWAEADATGLLAKMRGWYDIAAKYDPLKALYDQVVFNWNTAMGYKLPDETKLIDNIKFGSIDFSSFTTKLVTWYKSFNFTTGMKDVKFTGWLKDWSIDSLMRDAAGLLDVNGFVTRLISQVNSYLKDNIIAPVQGFLTELAVEILKLLFRIQVYEIKALLTFAYSSSKLLGPLCGGPIGGEDATKFISSGLAVFNSISDILLPNVGFRFVLMKSSGTGRYGDIDAYAYVGMHGTTSPNYTLRPHLKLMIPECYGKVSDWSSFVKSAFGTTLDRLLYDIVAYGQGGAHWDGFEYTGDQQTILTMSLGSDKPWFGGMKNLFNNWFGKLPLNLLDLSKTWAASTPVGRDGQISTIPTTSAHPEFGTTTPTGLEPTKLAGAPTPVCPADASLPRGLSQTYTFCPPPGAPPKPAYTIYAGQAILWHKAVGAWTVVTLIQ